jgi:hypothetical protein
MVGITDIHGGPRPKTDFLTWALYLQQEGSDGRGNNSSRVARWYIFKPKIPICVIF